MPSSRPHPPFMYRRNTSEAQREFTELVARRFAKIRDDYISPDNMLRYRHGEGWQTNYPTSIENEGKFKEFSAETNLKYEDVVNHAVPVISDTLQELVKEFKGQFVTSLFDLVSETTERTGNVVSAAQAGSNAQAFLQALEAVEFGVDRDGNVTKPNIHVGANQAKKLIQDLESEGQEFSDKVERVAAEKTEAALLREAERKAKFVGQGKPI
jgi:hypothetical protein